MRQEPGPPEDGGLEAGREWGAVHRAGTARLKLVVPARAAREHGCCVAARAGHQALRHVEGRRWLLASAASCLGQRQCRWAAGGQEVSITFQGVWKVPRWGPRRCPGHSVHPLPTPASHITPTRRSSQSTSPLVCTSAWGMGRQPKGVGDLMGTTGPLIPII